MKQIFAEATERSPAERRAFIDDRCEGDSALRAEVRGLLAAHEAAHEFLDPPRRRDAEVDDRRPGDTIGPYEIIERLGAGGMGTVYLCRRELGGAEQRVAIKVVKRGMDTEQVLARFRTEQRTLANLAHPNIASFLESGVSADGLPYIVMEYLQGERIDRHCDERKLTIPERVEIFRRVCATVQHAHQNLVVHRDLKPANIVISEDGEPKLLDFGLAKILSDDENANPLTVTAASRRFLTPEYASPEQAMGRPVTTSTDVYSLGVMLYELLTGRRPLELRGRSAGEIERALELEDPALPSAVVEQQSLRRKRPEEVGAEDPDAHEIALRRGATPERLKRMLAGDLDWIVMKALQKNPDRRYSSVEQFNEDLRRFLAGLPVLARRDTATYRITKFLRRHRTASIAALAIAIVLVVGAITTIWQANIASGERQRAEDARQRAERINAYTAQVLSLADPAAMGSRESFHAFLERASDQLNAELRDEPAARAQVHEEFGRVYYTHGDYNEALKHLQTALALRRSLGDTNDPELVRLLHLMGTVMTEAGRLDEAEDAMSEAIFLHARQAPEDELRRAGILENLIELRRAQGSLDEAESLAMELLDIYARAMSDEAAFVIARRALLADILLQRGDIDAALALYEECLQALTSGAGDNTVLFCTTLNGYAGALVTAGRLDDGERIYAESITLLESAAEFDSVALADALQGKGQLLVTRGQTSEGRERLTEALEIRESLLGAGHPEVEQAKSMLRDLDTP